MILRRVLAPLLQMYCYRNVSKLSQAGNSAGCQQREGVICILGRFGVQLGDGLSQAMQRALLISGQSLDTKEGRWATIYW